MLRNSTRIKLNVSGRVRAKRVTASYYYSVRNGLFSTNGKERVVTRRYLRNSNKTREIFKQSVLMTDSRHSKD